MNPRAPFLPMEVVPPRSTYVPVFLYDFWEGPLPFQGRHLGFIRVNSACPHFARFTPARWA